MVKLFQHPSLLEERPSDFDSLEYSQERDYVKSRLERLIKSDKHSIVAYLGPFGVGKSTILKEIKKITPEYRWIDFDMWRYSNRNELWDAFVIKVAAELTRGKDEFDIADEIEGSILNGRDWVLLFLWGFGIWSSLTFLSVIIWFYFKDGGSVGGQFWEAYFKYAAPTIFSVLILVGLGRFLQLNFITDKRPLKRVFELELKLYECMKKMRKPLIVVVEDVDRSAEDGQIFLETLNNFLGRRSVLKLRPIIVIAPQSLSTFDIHNSNRLTGIEAALKIYDEKIYFNSAISEKSIAKLYKNIGTNKSYSDKLSAATYEIVGKYKKEITIRLLKHALRETSQFVEMNPLANPVIVLSFILSRHVEVSTSGSTQQLALRTLEGGNEHGSENARVFFRAILIGIGKFEEGGGARGFVIKFTDKESGALFTHPSQTTRYDIELPLLYRQLII